LLGADHLAQGFALASGAAAQILPFRRKGASQIIDGDHLAQGFALASGAAVSIGFCFAKTSISTLVPHASQINGLLPTKKKPG